MSLIISSLRAISMFYFNEIPLYRYNVSEQLFLMNLPHKLSKSILYRSTETPVALYDWQGPKYLLKRNAFYLKRETKYNEGTQISVEENRENKEHSKISIKF